MCWIYIWTFTLTSQDEQESIFRVNQLRQVISKLKAHYRFNLKTDLFYLLISTVYHHSTYKTLSMIFDTMNSYEIVPDNRIKLMQFDCRREAIKQQNKKQEQPAARHKTVNTQIELKKQQSTSPRTSHDKLEFSKIRSQNALAAQQAKE